MTEQQDNDELDRSAVELAEASVSPADGELPFQRSDATVLTVNVEPNDDDVDSRMSEILLILDHAATRLLDKCALVAEWVTPKPRHRFLDNLSTNPRAAGPRAGLHGLLANLQYQAGVSERGASSSSELLRSMACGPR